jgi:hypothetical protein
MGRAKQRENRRAKIAEEELELCNCFGDEDPTPYLSVKNIIWRSKMQEAFERLLPEETGGEFILTWGDAG